MHPLKHGTSRKLAVAKVDRKSSAMAKDGKMDFIFGRFGIYSGL